MNNASYNRRVDTAFAYAGILATCIGLIALATLIIYIFGTGFGRLDVAFFLSLPSRFADKAGILTAWTGTLWIFAFTTLFAVPVGVAAGIYLEEYTKKGFLSAVLEINISNLAGIPSIIYGILGLMLFVRVMALGQSILSGSLILALLILPIIIVSTREALRAVPKTLKEASLALGASRWQTIWRQLLPASSAGIITGIILAISRAIGETAPLIMIGALTYVPFVAVSPMDEFTVLPIQIFNWVSRPQEAFAVNAAAGIIVLLLIVFCMNGIAVFFRNRAQNHMKW